MAVLTVTSRGQVTLKKEVLKHLGIEAGQKVEVDLLPGNCLKIQAVPKRGRIEDFVGILKGKSKRKTPVSIEEMNEVIAKGWAGEL